MPSFPTPAKSLSLSSTYFPFEERGGGKPLRLGSAESRFLSVFSDTLLGTLQSRGCEGAREGWVRGSTEAASTRPAGISARRSPQSPRTGSFPSPRFHWM